MRILECNPPVALPGGIIRIRTEEANDLETLRARVGEEDAEILGAGSSFILLRVPPSGSGELLLADSGGEDRFPLTLGYRWAGELHPVANPAIDPEGNVYVTVSGARGEEVPFGVFVIRPGGAKEPFLGDITNPTGLVFGPDGFLYISSRHTGTVYRSTPDKQVEKFAENLGIASGMAFDSEGSLFVGDRSGFIYKVDPSGEARVHCELEPSVSAYHLAFDHEDHLYVTGPTLATQDAIYRIDPEGHAESFFRGFGRPQGITFGPDGDLQVVGSYRGLKGVFSLATDSPERMIASPMLVGLAYGSPTTLYLVDGEQLFRVDRPA